MEAVSFDSFPKIRYLRIFEAVARLQSVTRASADVGLTQPAVTQAIAKLEHDLGEQLFDRQTTGTYLTSFGRSLIVRVRRLFELLEKTLVELGLPNDKRALASCISRVTRSQIRSHLAIARCQSFSEAASGLGISQSSLHRAAREIECNIGVPLYRHRSSGATTTEAGNQLATGLLLAMNEVECVLGDARAQRDRAANPIKIGTPMHVPAPFLAALLRQYTCLRPGSAVRVASRTCDELRQLLRAGLLDFAIGVLSEAPADLVEEPLFSAEYLVAARAGHPLASRSSIAPEELLDYGWVVPAMGSPRRQALDNLLAPTGGQPKIAVEGYSLETIRAILYDSDSIAILSQTEIAEDRSGLLVALRVGTLHPAPIIGVTRRSNWIPTPRQQEFLDLVRQLGRTQH